MALPAITAAEFIGYLRISTNQFTQEKLQNYIDDLYPEMVRKVLGDAALHDIENDPDPLADKWTAIFNGYVYENKDGYNIGLIPFKKMVIDMIYFEYQRDDFQATIAGNVKSAQENSDALTRDQNNGRAKLRYNRASRNINCSLYPFLEHFNVLDADITGITNVGTTYTVEVDYTEFLEVGDTVSIDRVGYTVTAVVTNTSFDVESSTPVLGVKATWEPYAKVCFSYPQGYII